MSADLASECPCPKCDAAQAGCDECGARLPVGSSGICSSCSGADPVREGYAVVPTSVDLAQEGAAIANILAALNELPEQSLHRVLDAVLGLIPPEGLLITRDRGEQRSYCDLRSGRIQAVVDTFGVGPEDDDVP